MRIIPGTHSPLIDKLQIKNCGHNHIENLLSYLHDKKVTLPPYINTKRVHQSYTFEK